MKPYQERVVQEHKELAEKLDKLESYFLSVEREALPKKEQSLLSAQLHAMLDYKNILTERIARFS